MIQLRGVRVNNLKEIDLDIPHGQLLTLCGVSGSGKTSLAFDTLFAEGQRRYLNSFSAYTRQFFQQFNRPDADAIENLLPAVSIRESGFQKNSSATVGSISEVINFLRVLYSRVATIQCAGCDRTLKRSSPTTIAREIENWKVGTRFLLTFPLPNDSDFDVILSDYRGQGFRRLIVDGKTQSIDDIDKIRAEDGIVPVVVDRLTVDPEKSGRLMDSLGIAFQHSDYLVVYCDDLSSPDSTRYKIDGKEFARHVYSRELACINCNRTYPTPSPNLFNMSSPLGACPNCAAVGEIRIVDQDLVVPDSTKSIRDGAIACWADFKKYAQHQNALLELDGKHSIDVDCPFCELQPPALEAIWNGLPDEPFIGLNPFFDKLKKRTGKSQESSFLNRWQSFEQCPECLGLQLCADARQFKLAGQSLPQICQLPVSRVRQFFDSFALQETQKPIASQPLAQIKNRLQYLEKVGVGYLSLNRPASTLSRGERQRVRLTTALASDLVNLLYILDEPSAGLHPHDTKHLAQLVRQLSGRGNTVVLVEHHESLLRQSDRIVELGPTAGAQGGEIVFDGSPEAILNSDSATGEFLSGRRGFLTENRRRPKSLIKLRGASGHNLKKIDIDFPLNCLCAVTGLSGTGKSTLVAETFFPAVANALEESQAHHPLPYEKIIGTGKVDEVLLIDESPIGKSSRSNPVTYVQAFEEIRKLFASTLDAQKLNFKPGHFSFNVEGGRCSACSGEGHIAVDMQFLPDVFVRCQQCQGKRFRPEVLTVKYRGMNIDDVLHMSIEQAFVFFRGQHKLQTKLKPLIDVGLGYLQLGQPANSLSTGEAQRLKMAYYLGIAKQSRTLFIMDEPTSGLHMLDIMKLLSCLDELIAVGHSIIVVEHNLQLIQNSDWVIDLGPEGGGSGGTLVAEGPPEKIASITESITGRYLQAAMKEFEL